MKVPCNIIRDLLPLYHDAICSEESKNLIDDHLSECEDCKSILSKINSEFNSHTFIDESKPLKTISCVWKKSKRKSFLKGSIIALVLCTILIGGYFGLTSWRFIPVSSDLLEISEVSQLSDGRIIYHLNVTDDKDLHFIKFTTNTDGSYYITPMRSLIEGKRITKSGLFNDYFMVDIAENNAYQQNHGDGIIITSCYLGSKNDAILIWKKGMKLPKASDNLEQMVSSGSY